MNNSIEKVIRIGGAVVLGGMAMGLFVKNAVKTYRRYKALSSTINENLKEIDEILKKEGYIKVGKCEWVHPDQIH